MSRWSALFFVMALSGCATPVVTKLYPENSPEREREHEFQEFHIKHLR